jgi:hypothetical protein
MSKTIQTLEQARKGSADVSTHLTRLICATTSSERSVRSAHVKRKTV